MVIIFSVNTVSCNLITLTLHHDSYSTMLNTGINGSSEQGLNLKRLCRSSDIPVLRSSSQNRIPDTSANRIGLIPGLPQRLYNIFYIFRKLNFNTSIHLVSSYTFIGVHNFKKMLRQENLNAAKNKS